MLSIRTLRWISVIGPTAFVVGFELFTRVLFPDIVPAWGHVVAALAAISTGAFGFSTFVFTSMARLERQIHERNRRLALLNTIATNASESLDLQQVATAICRNVGRALDAEAVAVALSSEDDGELHLAGQMGLPRDATGPDGTLGPYDCDCRKALALDGPVVRDARELPGCMGLVPNGEAATCVSVPTRSKGKGIGVLLVARRGTRAFTHDDLDLISVIGSQAGAVLQNAQLFSNTGAIAVLQERQRVAREVHDGLAQTLGYLNVQLGIVDQLLAKGQLDTVRGELETMSEVTRVAYEDLRHSITDLRTPLAVSGGIRRTLREYLDRFSVQTGIPCHFEGHTGSPAVLPPESEVQLLRIVQEALNNVRKHAPGGEIWLRVEADSRHVRAVIRDNGPGFDPDSISQEGRFGLHTMKERAEASGGALSINSRPGSGTTIEVTMPAEGVRAA
jgi:signal transduction histidine kinase